MRACRSIAGLALVVLAVFAVAQEPKFDWDWRNQEVIGREDPSVGNTSRLTEPERSSLIDAIVLRLQKPMGDAGYDDDRIREIATTTRIRFIDVGAGQPLIFATSIGLEGGCDALANCPLWVFRHTDDGFLSLLNTIAASFTAEPTEAGFQVVFMHHLSPKESGLEVYRFADEKLQATGCYRALWPKPSNDPNQLSDPKIEVCKQPPLVESARPGPSAPVVAEPAPQAPSAQQPAEPQEQTAPAPEAPPQQVRKAEQPPSAPDQQAPAPKSDQAPPEKQPSDQPELDAKPDQPPADSKPAQSQVTPDQPAPSEQPPSGQPAQPAPDNQSEPAPTQDQPQQQTPPANPAPPASDAK